MKNEKFRIKNCNFRRPNISPLSTRYPLVESLSEIYIYIRGMSGQNRDYAGDIRLAGIYAATAPNTDTIAIITNISCHCTETG